MTVCLVEQYTILPYAAALLRQQELAEQRRHDVVPDTIMLLEHPPTITLGRNATPDELLRPASDLKSRGVTVVETDRGGRSTYHGPGQIVGYPILDLRGHGQDLHRYLRNIEETIIRALALAGIAAGRIDGLTGVWVGDRKIAAIGVKARQWITSHGFSINVNPDLSVMRQDMIPCGIAGHGVTSVAEQLPEAGFDRKTFEPLLLQSLTEVFDFHLKYSGNTGIIAQ